MALNNNHLGHLTDNGFQKKGKVGRNFIFCLYFQSNMGRVFIFCFYFQQFNNITQTSSILLFWQTNNTIVFTVNRQDSRLAYPYDFGVRLTIFWAIKRPYDCCQFPYNSANLQYFWFRSVISLRFRGSKLLSITTQLHCGSHLGGRARLPDTILEDYSIKVWF